jgi:hypothetical protein
MPSFLSGRAIVARQRKQLDELKRRGRDTREAERTLQLSMDALKIFEDHLNALIGPPPSPLASTQS